jgi:hypothetical protein
MFHERLHGTLIGVIATFIDSVIVGDWFGSWLKRRAALRLDSCPEPWAARPSPAPLPITEVDAAFTLPGHDRGPLRSRKYRLVGIAPSAMIL